MSSWLEILEQIKNKLVENKNLLNDLDQAIGDGDHGTNMVHGIEAICSQPEKINNLNNKAVLNNCAMILLAKVGGSSGPLISTCLLKMASVIDDSNSQDNWYLVLNAGFEGIKMRGKSEVGEKTMLDAFAPLLKTFQENITLAWKELLPKLSQAANQGAEDTIPLIATKGRASYLKERSIGHMDPGAKSIALIVDAVEEKI